MWGGSARQTGAPRGPTAAGLRAPAGWRGGCSAAGLPYPSRGWGGCCSAAGPLVPRELARNGTPGGSRPLLAVRGSDRWAVAKMARVLGLQNPAENGLPLEIAMRGGRLFVEDIAAHAQRIPACPPAVTANRFRRGEAMCAHPKERLLLITGARRALACAACFAAGLENAVRSLRWWGRGGFRASPGVTGSLAAQ